MFEAISLVVFAGVMYFCLVVVPSFVEFVKNTNGMKVLSQENISVAGK